MTVNAPAQTESRTVVESSFVEVSAAAQGEFDYDTVTVQFRFQADGATAEAVTGGLSQSAKTVLEALTGLGLTEGDVRVIGPAVGVRYDFQRDQMGREMPDRRARAGFQGWIDIAATAKDLALGPKVAAAAIAAGALLSPPRYSLSRMAQEERRLAVVAVGDALAQARALAEAAGGRPGRVLSILDQDRASPRYAPAGAREAADAGPASGLVEIPVRPGRLTLGRTVTVRMELLR